MEDRKILGIDIGGTKVHIGLVQNGKVLKSIKFSTSAENSKTLILNKIKDGIRQFEEFQIDGIGIGVPGLIDEKKGIVYNVQNIPQWREVHLGDALEDEFEKPVFITNDANVFVLGIKKYGVGKELNDIVGITLGTGFGTGIVINGTLYSGQYSSAGEFGGVPYLNKTVEDYCSGKFFIREFGKTGKELMVLANEGDQKALDSFKQYGYHLGNAIKIILQCISPQAIFLGGSISQSFRFFQKPMFESIRQFPHKPISEKLIVECLRMENASLIGAAALFQMRVEKDIGAKHYM